MPHPAVALDKKPVCGYYNRKRVFCEVVLMHGAYILARYSTDRQNEDSIEVQVSACRKWCDERSKLSGSAVQRLCELHKLLAQRVKIIHCRILRRGRGWLCPSARSSMFHAPERSFCGFGTFIASFFLRSLSCFTPHQQQKIAASGISPPHCLHFISLFPPV